MAFSFPRATDHGKELSYEAKLYVDRDNLDGVFMNIQKLIETSHRPELYSKGTAVMWVDERISRQLLKYISTRPWILPVGKRAPSL